MAVEFSRTVGPETAARFETLNRVNKAQAETLARRFNRGEIKTEGAFDREVVRLLAEYQKLTSSDASRAAQRTADWIAGVKPLVCRNSADERAFYDCIFRTNIETLWLGYQNGGPEQAGLARLAETILTSRLIYGGSPHDP